MIRISKRSRLNPDEIIAKAGLFFGKGGEGLQETERGGCCISFAGAGGYATVTVSEENGLQEVDVKPGNSSIRQNGFSAIFEAGDRRCPNPFHTQLEPEFIEGCFGAMFEWHVTFMDPSSLHELLATPLCFWSSTVAGSSH